MAFNFIKKVFSFGKKEVVEEPVAEEKLAPINFEALEAFKRQPEPATPVEKDVPAAEIPQPAERPSPDAQLPLEEAAVREAERDEVIAPEASAPVLRTTPIEAQEAAGSAPAQPEPVPVAPEPAPTPEIEPAPAPAVPAPAPETPPPAPEVEPQPAPPVPAPAPQEVPPAEPARPVEIPHEPAPEPAPAPPEPAPQEVPAPEPARPVEIPHEPATPVVPEPAPAEVPPTATHPSPLSGRSVGEADRGGVAGSSSAETIAPPEQEAAPSAAEATPSAPPAAEHLPLKGGEDVASRQQAGKVTVSKKVEQKAELQPAAAPEAPRPSWFQRLRQGLSRSSKELTGNIAGVFTKRRLDEDTLQDLEDVLIRADLGVETALRITDALSAGRYGKNVSDEEVRAVMAEEIGKVLTPVAMPLELDLSHKPHVVLVVGVNGTGKTTTIGKLAAKLTEGGLSVMLAAGDTFRAAAIEQLKIWGERTKSPVVSSKLGADAAGLAYDAFEKAKEAGADVLIIDTAGRLQNKTELMAELEKIVRVLGKLDPDAPHTVLQTVDATTGQNALNQVEIFRNVAGVNGLVMTKLDGTARGGILVGIAAKYKLPVYFIGVGEQVDDLEPFSATDFAKAIAGVQ
ncbi:signal recognition particle-docking protein FtsY [Arvimicrobium flavum]|uniref:signal recognition particle-docking protein FtsY n=1 Tax=Arvimicrobium flavum TaxID=3393320 RepID=UPI00237B371E|nr:signal recognition particle-docking protein FtsY [Mesorhizobium shangrilense]